MHMYGFNGLIIFMNEFIIVYCNSFVDLGLYVHFCHFIFPINHIYCYVPYCILILYSGNILFVLQFKIIN